MKFFDSLKAKFNRVSDKIYYAVLNPGLATDKEKLEAEIYWRKNPNIRRVLQFHDKGITACSGYTPLEMAAMSGHSAVVTALLDHGVDVNQRAQRRNAAGELIQAPTAFYLAVLNKHPETAKVLAQRGALADFCDAYGKEYPNEFGGYSRTQECHGKLLGKEFAEVVAILKARGNNPATPKPPGM
jgi:hypothetical protein